MADKKLPKGMLDRLIGACVAFYSATCDAERECALQGMTQATRAFYDYPRPYALQDLVTGIVRLKDHATNEDIYKVLEVLGWTVE